MSTTCVVMVQSEVVVAPAKPECSGGCGKECVHGMSPLFMSMPRISRRPLHSGSGSAGRSCFYALAITEALRIGLTKRSIPKYSRFVNIFRQLFIIILPG